MLTLAGCSSSAIASKKRVQPFVLVGELAGSRVGGTRVRTVGLGVSLATSAAASASSTSSSVSASAK